MLADQQHPVKRRKKADQLTSKVDLRALKSFALEKLPKDWPLHDIILSEEDELAIQIFLARLSVWLRLSRVSDATGGK